MFAVSSAALLPAARVAPVGQPGVQRLPDESTDVQTAQQPRIASRLYCVIRELRIRASLSQGVPRSSPCPIKAPLRPMPPNPRKLKGVSITGNEDRRNNTRRELGQNNTAVRALPPCPPSNEASSEVPLIPHTVTHPGQSDITYQRKRPRTVQATGARQLPIRQTQYWVAGLTSHCDGNRQ